MTLPLRYSLLDESLIGVRLAADGRRAQFSLPGLFAALASDRIRDFPALRPHQRHPWHAFLVQLAALVLHRAGQTEPFANEAEWQATLLALTPDNADGAAWCLVTPPERPAFLQSPVSGDKIDDWEDDRPTPDSLDVLVTSKNHDLKQQRIGSAAADDWMFALVSLQTAAPYPGRGNFGVCRMNGGSSSRPGIGIDPPGGPGQRWLRDVRIALAERPRLVEQFGYADSGGSGLLWLEPWDGKSGKSFAALDPFFIEISRRIRLTDTGGCIRARRTTSATARIAKDESHERKGNTGDLWTPVEIASGKSLGVSGTGFHYKRMVELLFGANYRRSPTQLTRADDAATGLTVIARAIAGGQSTTDGYHERRIPISPTVRRFMAQKKTDVLAKIAEERVDAISRIRGVLWTALATLIENGAPKDKFSDGAKDKANRFAKPFEQGEDARFFDGPLGLNEELESPHPEDIRLRWYLAMAERGEAILLDAFTAGPRSGEQRYRARAAALSRFHGGLRSDKVLPTLARYYKDQKDAKETAHDQP